MRVQLYKYIFDTTKLIKSCRKESTPLVYFEFIFPSKSEYNGVLNVVLKLTPKPEFENVYEQSRSVF